MNEADRDMKWMALGEVGALLASGLAGFMAFVVLDDFHLPARITFTILAMYIVAQNALKFVHWKREA